MSVVKIISHELFGECWNKNDAVKAVKSWLQWSVIFPPEAHQNLHRWNRQNALLPSQPGFCSPCAPPLFLWAVEKVLIHWPLWWHPPMQRSEAFATSALQGQRDCLTSTALQGYNDGNGFYSAFWKDPGKLLRKAPFLVDEVIDV